MKLAGLEPFAAMPAQAVDYETELERFRTEKLETPPVTIEENPLNDATEDETRDGMVRFVDFLAKQRKKKGQTKTKESLALEAYHYQMEFEGKLAALGGRYKKLA